MITFVKYLVVTFIVSVAVNFFTYSTNPKNYTKSLNHFVIRAPLSMVPLGAMDFLARAEADRKKLYEMPEDEDYEEE